ncbi:MAG: hypothetical protein COW04_05230 [Deltaproteobacteria bacterium CG12_big_fil_rev_8_21_14_0_65_43_10]|nr:MAG: hypothetical protein AUK23_01470 [Deltaproteobacteria bacterium CG2_30_43_15]PIQ45898.1 MAG: hypothetical protein COW04_05230 [Deltaproteobacteria bacterium CG12_big_fil_rev_8_21_14_0_65_43_10]PIU85376.1 MAG: hypothetical protein COS67_08210 [Deltaproteobacteria bacterium CG06_land_8_20_14_3_00_44_19]PIX22082.1 MAG: hypothetical protein COZ68_13100 [Deltaproteobacteria bacterium CG_4_8_14_3_um_filter_43_13]PIZ20373.1 MAG: hypothetical protein COY50_05105 [Deltaproteobacteria bacterium C
MTHHDRLPKELAFHGITDMDAANRYLAKEYKPSFNAEYLLQKRTFLFTLDSSKDFISIDKI